MIRSWTVLNALPFCSATEVAALEARLDATKSDLQRAQQNLRADAAATKAEFAIEAEAATSRLEAAMSSATNQLAGTISSSVNRALTNLGGEIETVADELQETRRWVGDLAHCLIYEADLRGYTFSYADGFGGFFGNRGEWDTSFVGEDQMSHCER